MSKLFSRSAFFEGAYGRVVDSGSKPTTLSESGDRSPKGFGYVNTGTNDKRGSITMQANGQPYFQPGSETNTSQTAQARDGFMGMRKSQLYTEDNPHASANENRMGRRQAVLRLKESY